MSSYHLKEKASGSNLFIPSEKTKNSSALNDNGNITNKGAIKKKKTDENNKKELEEIRAESKIKDKQKKSCSCC